MRQNGMTEFAPLPSSAMPGIVWPAMPGARDAATLAIFAQLEMSQWWPPEALLRHQLRQAAELVRFAARAVPFYRDRLAAFAHHPGALTLAEWQRIPLLTRADIQDAGAALSPGRPLTGHGDPYDVKTSGSTGAPVTVRGDAVTARFHAAFTLRDHIWHRRDFSAKVAVVRRLTDEVVAGMKAGKRARWAGAHSSGPMVFLDVTNTVDDALKWLAQEKPGYLMTYPTYLRALIRRGNDIGFDPSGLREVATFGEIVPDDLRVLCAQAWGARLVDTYSTQEIGIVALDCPDHDHYLVQSEGVLVEILDEDGRPCAPGAVGRVVLTPLHNFASPLIRYSIGDYAEVGQACASGRGLPVIRRFFGRARNMLKLPSGNRVWVALTGCGLEKIEPLRQFQVVQKPNLAIDLKLVVDRPLNSEEEIQARQAMQRATGHVFEVHIDYVDSISRSLGGKLEDVVSEAVD